MRRGQRLLRQGQWQQALTIVEPFQNGRNSVFWEGSLRNLAGECHRTAGIQTAQAKDFEQALAHHLQAAELFGANAGEARAAVVEKMLAEIRALFAATVGADTQGAEAMIARTLALQSPSAEASFWQGLCHIRTSRWELAKESLLAARTIAGPEQTKTPNASAGFIDPPLYLGGVLLRFGQPKEALRYITEANRIDGNCPMISLHLGLAMVAAGADGNLAIRALNRALTARGLAAWLKEPDKAWSEGLPENHSFIRKLTAKHRFVCPLWGNDLRALMRQGQLAMGQAHFRLEQFQAAAGAFQKMLDDMAPTHDALRGLGLALTRLQRYDEAFKHLKTALELENPQDRLTAGYLAVCAACAKPDRPEDKGPNVTWAVRTARQFTGLGDSEWVAILSEVWREARRLNIALSAEDHIFLCDHLQSVEATDRDAAAAYHQLAVEHPAFVKPAYAWLYCRAAMLESIEHERALDLFTITFQSAEEARPYFAAHQWDFDELEYTFLKVAAAKAPGAFPAVLGADYPARAEAKLLDRSQRMEAENKADAALASADVLLRFGAPQHAGSRSPRHALLSPRQGRARGGVAAQLVRR